MTALVGHLLRALLVLTVTFGPFPKCIFALKTQKAPTTTVTTTKTSADISQDAAPSSACSVLETGIDYQGNDIGVGKAKTVSDCCAECAATPGCAAFTVWMGGPQCYLKRNASGRRAASNHTSGKVDHPMPSPATFIADTDCAMRSLLVAYAASVNPMVNSERQRQMVEALMGDPKLPPGCVINSTTIYPYTKSNSERVVVAGKKTSDDSVRAIKRNYTDPAASPSSPANNSAGDADGSGGGGGLEYFVDAAHGSDSASGTIAFPFKTIEHAVATVRAQPGPGTVTLRAGVYHLTSTLHLGRGDNGLTIRSYEGDTPKRAWLSGAMPLTGVIWKPVQVKGTTNIWSADLSNTTFHDVPGLRVGGDRLWRARYPNGNPETSRPFDAQLKAKSWLQSSPNHFPPIQHLSAPSSTNRNDTLTDKYYTMCTGGPSCTKYTPPISHYCCGGSDAGAGVVFDTSTTLPNAPYANPAGATITAMHGGLWCSFSYNVSSGSSSGGDNRVGGVGGDGDGSETKKIEENATTYTMLFNAGGQQCNRPEGSHGQVLIEGVLEELDEPGEFFFDAGSRTLTLFHNGTAGTPPPNDGTLEVTLLNVLVNVTGTQAAPVVGISLSNLGFRDTRSSLFEPHIAPTGGDWAVNRAAAVTASGAENLDIGYSTFWRLDNAGIFLGGYNRGATVHDNEFAWLGESAIVSVGDTEGAGFEKFPGFGWDGLAGNQPRQTTVRHNFAHELGIYNKQSAMYFQAATANSTVTANIIFNGARSGINFNDAFGGGSRVLQNVMFNLNRETADHGCFNSWDRLPFTPAKGPQRRDLLTQNLALSNFNSYNGLDTDDDSAYFYMLKNVLFYGHVLKSDFSGHDIEYSGDFGVFTGPSNQYQPVPSNHRNALHDSVFLSATGGENLFDLSPATCNGTLSDFPFIYNVKVFSPAADTTICKQSLAVMEGKGLVKNVTAGDLNSWTPESVVVYARQTLGMD